MPTFRSITTSLTSHVDMLEIPEYLANPAAGDLFLATQSSSASKNEAIVSVYVPAIPNSQFRVNYSIGGPHPPEALYFFKLFINDKQVTSWSVGKEDGFKGKVEFGLYESGEKAWSGKRLTQRRALCFGEDNADSGPSQNCLEIRAYRCEFRQKIAKDLQRFASSEVGLAEAQNTLGGIKMINAGVIQEKHPHHYYKHQLLDPLDEPFATFRYYCRSANYLQSHGIIEPSDAASEVSTRSSSAVSHNFLSDDEPSSGYARILLAHDIVGGQNEHIGDTNNAIENSSLGEGTSITGPSTTEGIGESKHGGDVFAKLAQLARNIRPHIQNGQAKQPLIEDDNGQLIPLSKSPSNYSLDDGDLLGKLARLLPVTESPSTSTNDTPGTSPAGSQPSTSPSKASTENCSLSTSPSKYRRVVGPPLPASKCMFVEGERGSLVRINTPPPRDPNDNGEAFDKLAKIAEASPPLVRVRWTRNCHGVMVPDDSQPPEHIKYSPSESSVSTAPNGQSGTSLNHPSSSPIPLRIDVSAASSHRFNSFLSKTPVTPFFLKDSQLKDKPTHSANKTTKTPANTDPAPLHLELDGVIYSNVDNFTRDKHQKPRRPLSPFGAGGLLRRSVPGTAPPTITSFSIDTQIAEEHEQRQNRLPLLKKPTTAVNNHHGSIQKPPHGATMTILKGLVNRATARKAKREAGTTPSPEKKE